MCVRFWEVSAQNTPQIIYYFFMKGKALSYFEGTHTASLKMTLWGCYLSKCGYLKYKNIKSKK